jgi:NADPH:quinone reductase
VDSATTMTAVRRTAPGVVDVTEVPVPSPGEGEVLVRVRHAGVNPFDLQVLRGEIGSDPSSVLTLGAEAVGDVDGRLVQVSGLGLGAGRDGTFATWVTAPAGAVRALPEGVDPRQAATVGIAGRTAWRAVHQLAEVGADDVVLVLGASGGVGTVALQLAHATGARVLAPTGEEAKAGRLRELGVDAVVATTPAELAAQVADAGVSVVLDPLGGDYVGALLPVLSARARVVTYGVLAGREGRWDLGTLYAKGIRVIGTSGGTTPLADAQAALEGALAAVASGAVQVEVESVPLTSAPLAFDRLVARTVSGKVVLDC